MDELYGLPFHCFVYIAFVTRFHPTIAESLPFPMKTSEIHPSHVV